MRLNGGASRRALGTRVLLLEILPGRGAPGMDGVVAPSTRAPRGAELRGSQEGAAAFGRDVVVVHDELGRSFAVLQAHDGETACRGER